MLNTLLLVGVTSAIISIAFRKGANKHVSLVICIIVSILGLGAKLFYEGKGQTVNYYNLLEVKKDSSALDIRQSYKKISKKLHPDKNTSPNAEEEFARAKKAYDVLMDESLRDIYNRFGESELNFDPRKDELKLLSTISFQYVFYFILIYLMTVPISSRASRTWNIFVLIGVMITEITLKLTETSLPPWLATNVLEHELLYYLHLVLPGIILILKSVAEYVYIDVDTQCQILLTHLLEQQKAMDSVLTQLIPMIESMNGETQVQASLLETMKTTIEELQYRVHISQGNTITNMELLKKANTNILASYYWVVFVILYAGVYLLQ